MGQNEAEKQKEYREKFSKKFVKRLLRAGRLRDPNLTRNEVLQALWADHLDHQTRPRDRGPLLDGHRTLRRTTDIEREFLASLHQPLEVGVRRDRAGKKRWPRTARLDGPVKNEDGGSSTLGEVILLDDMMSADADAPRAEPSALDHLMEREREEQIADLLSNSGLSEVERAAVLDQDRHTSKQAVWKASRRAFKKLRARARARGWMPEVTQCTIWSKEYLVSPRWLWLRPSERWRWGYVVAPYPLMAYDFEYVAPRQPSRPPRPTLQWSLWRPEPRSYVESPPPLGLESAKRGPVAIYFGARIA